ncbi:MAG: peptidylprolyl isomerase [Alphaproteobacteria bacterium]
MISFFNKLGNSWIAKGIFLLLVVSMMAFWGLGGLSNTSTFDGTAMTVGTRKISVQEVSRTFDQERNKMARISGGYMTPKRAIQAGLLDQVVRQLASRELNTQIQEEVGLAASDNSVRGYIEQNPVFKDSLGKFDANLFYTYLSGLNMSQAEFAHQMRSELANQHLARSVAAAVPKNQKLLEQAAKAQKEQREIVSTLLTPKQMPLTKPTEQDLKDYYEAYLEEFKIPEYRTVRIVSFTSKDFKGENVYEQMGTLSRQLEDLLGAGQTLKKAAESLKLNTGRTLVVDISGKDKNQKEVSENIKPLLQEIFSLSDGEATSLMEIENGFMVASVEKISPQSYRDFASVQTEVARLWQRENRQEALSKTAEEVLASVKQQKGWKGYTPTNQTVSQTESAHLPKILIPALLSQKLGPENAMQFPTENGILIAYVKRVIPSTAKPSEAEITEAVKAWNQDLMAALEGAYLQKYPVNIHTNVLQKAFSIYDSEDE